MAECRICKQIIDKEQDDWVMPSKNWYYHRKCYEDWKKSEPLKDEQWHPFIYDFISRDLKVSYNYHMCEAQIKKFIKENKMTMKGIYFTLKYFYEVKHNDWYKGHGGLGIIPYVYNEACAYWVEQERLTKGIVADIERQMRESAERQKKIIIKKVEPEKKFKVDLSAIGEMEDDEW